ncbi:MAG TPA: hypothetical protein VKB38_14040 [Terracidiphilus sp.]|nr:hypothetical protein [Terracidiphilus sp.]
MLPRALSFSVCAFFSIASMLGSALGSAQSRPKGNEGVPNWDLYAGYSYIFSAPGTSGTNGGSGWDSSFKVPILGPLLGIKGDVSGFNSKDGPDISTKHMFFLVGPQVGLHISTSTVWLHGMLGSSNLSSSATPDLHDGNSFALAVGAGLDAGMSRRLAWRVTGDFFNTHFQRSKDNVNEVKNSSTRFSTGPLFRF